MVVQSQPQANSSRDVILKKKKSQKRVGGVAQGVGPEFKLPHHTHTKKTDGNCCYAYFTIFNSCIHMCVHYLGHFIFYNF
jgi:hypothetical protein